MSNVLLPMHALGENEAIWVEEQRIPQRALIVEGQQPAALWRADTQLRLMPLIACTLTPIGSKFAPVPADGDFYVGVVDRAAYDENELEVLVDHGANMRIPRLGDAIRKLMDELQDRS